MMSSSGLCCGVRGADGREPEVNFTQASKGAPTADAVAGRLGSQPSAPRTVTDCGLLRTIARMETPNLERVCLSARSHTERALDDAADLLERLRKRQLPSMAQEARMLSPEPGDSADAE